MLQFHENSSFDSTTLDSVLGYVYFGSVCAIFLSLFAKVVSVFATEWLGGGNVATFKCTINRTW